MKYQIFSENEWLYPDSEITAAGNGAVLHAARGGDVCFQVLTDRMLAGGERIACDAAGLAGGNSACDVIAYQLMPAYVSENSGPKLFTTTNYDEVKDFVTRKAPFTVYDITRPTDSGTLEEGRAAFFIRLNIAADAVPGEYAGGVTLTIDGETLALPVSLKIYAAQIPALADSAFHMINWLYYPLIAEQFGVEPYSEKYLEILGKFFENELDMRNDYLMIPAGVPVRDDAGKVIDFDFTNAAIVGNLALKYGFKYILGGFVARFIEWNKDEHFLLWDREVGVTTLEGYRQMKLYFSRAWECVTENGWQEHYMQCMVDEPQFPNSLAYRALAGICRKQMPGVKIHDPVETTDIAGALDVWAVKQAVYEKYIDTFRALQDMGEEMWLYTCGFPAGATMNRVMDLPLTVSRMPMWLCYKYGCPGFLHWGYHYYKPGEGLTDGCIPADGGKYPPGNAHIVYVGDGRPWYSVRGHAQRTGAQDYELLHQLGIRDRDAALALVHRICRSFDDYDGSAEAFDAARRALLAQLG